MCLLKSELLRVLYDNFSVVALHRKFNKLHLPPVLRKKSGSRALISWPLASHHGRRCFFKSIFGNMSSYPTRRRYDIVVLLCESWMPLSLAEFQEWWPSELEQFHFQRWLSGVSWVINIHCKILEYSKTDATTPWNNFGCNITFLDIHFHGSCSLHATFTMLNSDDKQKINLHCSQKQFGIWIILSAPEVN